MATDTMTTSEAAQALHISSRQVQRLVDNGTIQKVGSVGRSLLLDTRSVLALAQRGGTGRGRSWKADTVWAALALLNGEANELDNASRRWHLRERLTRMNAQDLTRSARTRADVLRFRASASFLESIASEITRTGLSALADQSRAQDLGLAVARSDTLDGYVMRDQIDDLVRRFHLVDDANGNLTLRIVDHKHGTLLNVGGVAATSVIAIDLADSLDPRQRAAATHWLENALACL